MFDSNQLRPAVRRLRDANENITKLFFETQLLFEEWFPAQDNFSHEVLTFSVIILVGSFLICIGVKNTLRVRAHGVNRRERNVPFSKNYWQSLSTLMSVNFKIQ